MGKDTDVTLPAAGPTGGRGRLRPWLRARRRRPGRADPPTGLGRAHLSDFERSVLEHVRPYTLTSDERILATIDGARHVFEGGIPGALAECGVWLGGSVLAMIRVALEVGVTDREIYLFDTFDGMTEPTEADVSRYDRPALETWRQEQDAGRIPWDWAFDPAKFNLGVVQEAMRSSGYPPDRIHFVVGRVEDTLPDQAPDRLALLRLDTDWYESTRHEMHHLYPRLSPGGVLIIDDYGHWEGSRRAVDEYFEAHPPRPLLCRSDYAGRIGTKPTQP
jgi:O-methyltransferase